MAANSGRPFAKFAGGEQNRHDDEFTAGFFADEGQSDRLSSAIQSFGQPGRNDGGLQIGEEISRLGDDAEDRLGFFEVEFAVGHV